MSESTLERLLNDCYAIQSDIDFLQTLWQEHVEVSESVLNPNDWSRLEEIIPDIAEKDYPDLWFAFTDCALELKVEGLTKIGWSGDKSETLSEVFMVLTTGGPHIEIVADYNKKRLEVRGYWSNESCTVQLDAESLYDHMINYGEEMLTIR